MILTNKNEKNIVQEIHNVLQQRIQEAPESDESSTFVPYYDSILDEHDKHNLAEVKMSYMIYDKVKNQSVSSYTKKNNSSSSTSSLI